MRNEIDLGLPTDIKKGIEEATSDFSDAKNTTNELVSFLHGMKFNDVKRSIYKLLPGIIYVILNILNDKNNKIKKLEKENIRLKKLSYQDPLTGIYNRNILEDRIRSVKENPERNDKRVFSFAFIDLDKFKGINDTYGHDAGDKVLKYFTEEVLMALNETKKKILFYRSGGDEFGIISKLTGKELKDLLNKKFKDFQNEKFIYKNQEGEKIEIEISFSAGITDNKPGLGESIIPFTDTLLYKAKKGVDSTGKVLILKKEDEK